MNLFFLIFLLIGRASGSDVPNFYSTYTSARDASKTHDMDLVIFFSNSRCSRCTEAWSAFIKDTPATKQYVSTHLDAEDFDGKVLFEKYELNETPSWVILSPHSEVKEQWMGGWKDAAGNPTLYAEVKIQTQKAPPMKNPASKQHQNPVAIPSVSTGNKTTSYPDTPPSKKDKEEISTSMAHPTDVSPQEEISYVLQAGYFGSEVNAQKMLEDLKTKGFENFLIKITHQNGSKYYRVVSSTYPSEEAANKAIPLLTTHGFKVTVKKTTEI